MTLDVVQFAREEFVGRTVGIAVSNDPTLVGYEGTVVDETMGTFTIEADQVRRVVGKAGQQFAFKAEGETVLLDGASIAYRPEDRIKKARVKR